MRIDVKNSVIDIPNQKIALLNRREWREWRGCQFLLFQLLTSEREELTNRRE